MKVTIKKTFLKDIQRVVEPQKTEVKNFLEQLANSPYLLKNVKNIKKLRTNKKQSFFRIRFGEYRLGYEKKKNEIVIYRILHRKDIYRYFP
ncbi:mRNA interferase RelE/StbE [Candidatus Magnetomoraceae bacterium gMMP-15]